MHTFLLLEVLCLSLVLGDQVTFGSVRLQTLSPTLIRVETKGPKGWEDRTTFMVTNRQFAGVPIISVTNQSDGSVTVSTAYYHVSVSQQSVPSDSCYGAPGVDVDVAFRSPKYPNGLQVNNLEQCCVACQQDANCQGWVYDNGANCWPLNSWQSLRSADSRTFGCRGNQCFSAIQRIVVTDLSGVVLLDQPGAQEFTHLLHWPSPGASKGYVLSDYPRFYVPPWGPTPHGNDSTNGYDFTNNQNGDFYIFLLGSTLQDWFASRAEFVKLVGPTPLLPDFAYGTWFTYWYSYTEQEAKHDIAMWNQGQLPLSVYGLDMNWRYTSNNQDRSYDHPNTDLFPNFEEWFSFLHSNGLKTYFNDHPFPVDWQTSPKEIAFRYGGLTEWLSRGLDYWWFDHNWGFSIPPPNVYPINGWDVSNTDGSWFGLDNAAWGSHVYFETVAQYYSGKGSNVRPMILSKFALPDWRPDMPSTLHQESPAQHRYPVWWTGDGVDLKASVQSMVDAGVHDFKPFVHSDCGGDYRGSAGDLLRWTAHCVFGTILRFHGSDHRPWTYDAPTESTIKSYLDLRYKLIPSLISAGQGCLHAGFPLVVRGDLLWPEYSEASSNNQYIHLNDTLVAPIWDSTNNITTRSVWIPPGQWQDAWDGSIVSGPKTISVSKPYEQIPMWHQRGTFKITVNSPALRIEAQDWSVLTLEVFPDFSVSLVHRVLYNLGSAATTDLWMHSMSSDRVGSLVFNISECEEGTQRGWVVRLHQRVSEECFYASVDGEPLEIVLLRAKEGSSFFPFGGVNTYPAPNAGPIAQVTLPKAHQARLLEFKFKI